MDVNSHLLDLYDYQFVTKFVKNFRITGRNVKKMPETTLSLKIFLDNNFQIDKDFHTTPYQMMFHNYKSSKSRQRCGFKC